MIAEIKHKMVCGLEDEPEFNQDEQIHDVRTILNGKLDWSAFTSERAYELSFLIQW